MAKPAGARGETRRRVLDAAMTLFARHGVAGTSLQMIADEVGVTKAAVYFQFRTKDEIVLALLEDPLRRLETILDAARAETRRDARVERVLTGLIDLVLDYREGTTLLQRDPALRQVLERHGLLERASSELREVVLGPRPPANARVSLALLGAGLLQIGTIPEIADLPEATLRREMLAAGRRLLGLADEAPARGATGA